MRTRPQRAAASHASPQTTKPTPTPTAESAEVRELYADDYAEQFVNTIHPARKEARDCCAA